MAEAELWLLGGATTRAAAADAHPASPHESPASRSLTIRSSLSAPPLAPFLPRLLIARNMKLLVLLLLSAVVVASAARAGGRPKLRNFATAAEAQASMKQLQQMVSAGAGAPDACLKLACRGGTPVTACVLPLVPRPAPALACQHNACLTCNPLFHPTSLPAGPQGAVC